MGPQGITAKPGVIRRRRTAAGLSVTTLAQRCGISRPHLSNVERGRRACGVDTAGCIAAQLGAKVTDLFNA